MEWTKERGTSQLSYVCQLTFDWLERCLRQPSSSRSKIRGEHANKHRNSDMMEELFGSWAFAGAQPEVWPDRSPVVCHDGSRELSSTIALAANCMDWAKHRRRKAAAKLHLRLNLQSPFASMTPVRLPCVRDYRQARRQGLRPLCQSVQLD